MQISANHHFFYIKSHIYHINIFCFVQTELNQVNYPKSLLNGINSYQFGLRILLSLCVRRR